MTKTYLRGFVPTFKKNASQYLSDTQPFSSRSPVIGLKKGGGHSSYSSLALEIDCRNWKLIAVRALALNEIN